MASQIIPLDSSDVKIASNVLDALKNTPELLYDIASLANTNKKTLFQLHPAFHDIFADEKKWRSSIVIEQMDTSNIIAFLYETFHEINPSKSKKVWESELLKLDHRMITQMVFEGLKTYNNLFSLTLKNELWIYPLPNIEVLKCDYCDFQEISMFALLKRCILNNCKYLYVIKGCPNLQVLFLYQCNGWKELCDLTKMKKINIMQSDLFNTVRFCSIDELTISECVSFTKIEDCTIKELSIIGCEKQIVLRRITGLRKLSITNCTTVIIEDTCDLSGITSIECDHVTFVCKKISHFDQLEVLRLTSCFVETISSLPKLKTLELDFCPHLKAIKRCDHVQVLNINACSALKDIHSFPALIQSTIRQCSKLEKLEDCPLLRILNVYHAGLLIVSHLPSLASLTMEECFQREPSSEKYKKGYVLQEDEYLYEGRVYKRDHFLEGCPAMQYLKMTKCIVRELYNIHLKELYIDMNIALVVLENIHAETVDITMCTKLKTVKNIFDIRMLKISNCASFESIQDVVSVKTLSIVNCASFVHVENLYNIEECVISSCKSFKTVENLKECVHLTVEFCLNFDTVKGCFNLKRISLISTNRIKSIPEHLVNLETIYVDDIAYMKEIANFENVKTLLIKNCPALKSVVNLPNLETVQYKGSHVLKFDKCTLFKGTCLLLT